METNEIPNSSGILLSILILLDLRINHINPLTPPPERSSMMNIEGNWCITTNYVNLGAPNLLATWPFFSYLIIL